MNIGPMYSDPVARQLYAEIASIEEQHVTQYESIIDPEETWLEKWVMHELTEVYNYHGCMEQESNPRIKAIWERFLDYELGHLHMALELFKKHEKRDPEEILPESLPDPIPHASQREFVRETLAGEVDLRANGAEIVPKSQESKESILYRKNMNADGSPSETVSAGYKWAPGSELKLKVA
jgi:rubrerythrin